MKKPVAVRCHGLGVGLSVGVGAGLAGNPHFPSNRPVRQVRAYPIGILEPVEVSGLPELVKVA